MTGPPGLMSAPPELLPQPVLVVSSLEWMRTTSGAFFPREAATMRSRCYEFSPENRAV